MEATFILLFVIIFSSPVFLVLCKPKQRNDDNRRVDRSKATVDARSRGNKKKSTETAKEGKPVEPSKIKPIEKELTAEFVPSKEVGDGVKTNTNKKKSSKSKEKTVTKTNGTTEDYDPKDEVTAPDHSEKKDKTVVATAEEKPPSEQKTQDGSIEVVKKRRKPKTEEFMESQGDDDTLKCVKSICN